MKKFYGFLTMSLLTSIIIAGCGTNESISQTKAPLISVEATLADQFNYLKDLKTNAKGIVEVSIESQETVEYGQAVFTISNATVISSTKGSLKEGDIIRVLETGGILKSKSEDVKQGAEPQLNEVEIAIEGVPVAKKGEHLFLFLDKYKGGVTSKETYVPVGGFQGKFKIEKDKVVQQAPKKARLKDYNGEESIENFKGKVKKLKEDGEVKKTRDN